MRGKRCPKGLQINWKVLQIHINGKIQTDSKDVGRLQHMLDAINTLMEHKGHYSFGEVTADPIIFYGFVKHVEIIGEAVYMLTKEFRAEHPEVDWDVIEGMRHVLVHGYYQIRPSQLWNTVVNDIPELKPYIEKYLSELSVDNR